MSIEEQPVFTNNAVTIYLLVIRLNYYLQLINSATPQIF